VSVPLDLAGDCLVEVTKQLFLTDMEVTGANAAEGAAASAAATAAAAAAAEADAAAVAADIGTGTGASRRLLGSLISAHNAQNSQQTMTPAAVGPPRYYSPGNIMLLLATSYHAIQLKKRRFKVCVEMWMTRVGPCGRPWGAAQAAAAAAAMTVDDGAFFDDGKREGGPLWRSMRGPALIRFVAQEEGLLSLTSDAPRMFFNFEDYLKHAQADRVNQGFQDVLRILRGPQCLGRLHWGKAGDRRNFRGWLEREAGVNWCHFQCAAKQLDPTGWGGPATWRNMCFLNAVQLKERWLELNSAAKWGACIYEYSCVTSIK